MLSREGIQDHRRYRAVRSFLNVKAREDGIPLTGVFELTPLCNLDCKMCYVHLTKGQMGQQALLRADAWKSLMEQAITHGMMYAKLSGGECLTHPDFKELYLFLQERGIEIEILTNGTLLNQDMADFLRENPPAAIQITLYGASEDGYLRVTGNRGFSTVMENIRRLQEYGLPLSIAVTPNAFMTDGEDILRLSYELGLPARINCSLMTPREETGRQKADADLDTYIRLFQRNFELGETQPYAPCDEDALPEPGGTADATPCGVLCGAGRSGFSIGWNGEMRPCNTFPKIRENALLLGFSEAWRRVHQQATEFPRPVECENCTYQSCCSGCVSEHAADAPIGHASPLVCARTKRMLAVGLLKQ